ncbi:MAG TPA: asparagine synthase (glutamine-hydrolyzing) [Gammaproteobacteria bacterium]|nr:asparagine synthase (glutamine-hydrolyzing) [Gammaproteobacteria bacterium]
MCGIAGFTQFNHQFGNKQTLEKMGNAILHRGPDAGGVYLHDNIGLSHRRLSIIDLSESGNQPMVSHDGRYIIVFNGEIYNFLALRDELIKQNYPFKTHTDTEVLLALYEQCGKDVLDKINGMFAFAIWDTMHQSLFIARDRIGKKPLYYYKQDNDIVFASELKAILTLPGIPRKIRLEAVYDFFAYQYIPDPKTIFENIYKLEPGHYLEITENSFTKTKYWDISFAKQNNKSTSEIKKELQQLLKECTKKRMISDVPLGAFLSGGVDSSGIVAMMTQDSDSEVTTCSIGFDDDQFNETEFAKAVAEKYYTKHHELTVHQNVNDSLEKIVSYFDEPFADPSLVPTYYVSELARQKVTVAIAGDGGDEVFAGYEKYTTDNIENNLRKLFPKIIRTTLFPFFASILERCNNTYCKKGSSLLHSLSLSPAMGFYVSNSQITDSLWRDIITDDTRDKLGSYQPSQITTDFYEQCDGNDHLSRILYTDMKTYLPGGILVKVDRMSMANSLEVRAPILDFKLMEFAATLPSNLKYNNGEKKYILKEAFKDYLPDDILYRKKMGFSVPLADWLRNEIKPLAEQKLFNSSSGLNNYFKTSEIRKIWDQHQSGERDYSTPLWSMLMFQMWWDNYMQT